MRIIPKMARDGHRVVLDLRRRRRDAVQLLEARGGRAVRAVRRRRARGADGLVERALGHQADGLDGVGEADRGALRN